MCTGRAAAKKERLTFLLPCPPSVNSYYFRGKTGVFVTEKGKEYRQLTQIRIKVLKMDLNLESKLRLWVVLDPPDRKKRDADNILKCLLDSLQSAEVYKDDSQIADLRVLKKDFKPGLKTEKGCHVIIETLTDDEFEKICEECHVF